jgi:hypothetical protein
MATETKKRETKKRAKDGDLIERRCRCTVGRKDKRCIYVVRRIDHPDGLCFTCRMDRNGGCYRH